jgi:hypothetical protein
MNPSKPKDTPANLLRELENLQKVLDGSATILLMPKFLFWSPSPTTSPFLMSFLKTKKSMRSKPLLKRLQLHPRLRLRLRPQRPRLTPNLPSIFPP